MTIEATRLESAACLTVAEVAAALRVSKMTVYRLVHAGSLAALRIGGAIRVPEAALDSFLQDAAVDRPLSP